MIKTDKASAGRIFEALSSLKPEAKQRFKAEIKGIFGSYVRSEQKEGSDLDVLVEFDEGANLLHYVGLAEFLEEKLQLRVDVVPESALRKEIKESILREKVAV